MTATLPRELCPTYVHPVSHTRVAVVQIDFHPAALLERQSPLEDPLFDRKAPNSLLPASGLVPEAVRDSFEQLRARVRREHNRCLMLKLRAVLGRCSAWGVKLVVLPEYAVAAELLPELAAIAPELVIVAGTHAVERAQLREGIYAQLGWTEAPRSGMAVAPVLHRGRLLGLQPKLSPAAPEQGSLVCGDGWAPIELELGGGPVLPGPLGVMICLDFLYRERPVHREQVGPQLDRTRFLAVPSYTPWHSAGEFADTAWQEARRYGRPVLWANVASEGGSSIFVDEGRVQDLRDYPRRVGLLERGDEGVIVADVDLGYQRRGESTRYADARVVKSVAVASLVYRHHPIGDRYAEWIEQFEGRLDGMSEDEAAEEIEAARQQLLDAASLARGSARERRIRRLLHEIDRVNQIEEFRQFTREIVLPGEALPLAVLRQAWARECAELVFECAREHRGEGLEEVERQLREAGRLEVEAEQWTEAGREALRVTSEAIRGERVTAQSEAVVAVRERVPSSIVLHQFELEGEGLKLVFRGSPTELARLDEGLVMYADSRVDARLGSPRWSTDQLAIARRVWLLQRAQGHLDATVLGAHGLGGSAVLVCVREAGRRILLAAAWNPDERLWLREHRDSILRVAASCCDELRLLDPSEHDPEVNILVERFAAAEAAIDAAVEFQLRELAQASTPVLVQVDGAEQPEVGLDVLDGWLDRSEQVALVTGPFGTGKSTLLAQWCQRRWRTAGVRPILVNLATTEQREPLAALLAAAGCDPSSEPDRAALSLLLLEGKLVACFDGFDEMVTRLAFADVRSQIARLLEVARYSGRVLIASRDHYFSTERHVEQDMQDALSLAGLSGLLRLRLQPFGAEQIADVVEQFIADPEQRERVLAKLHSTYDLADLVQTPMLLSMVLQTIDELVPDARVGSATVYERYLDSFLAHAEIGDPELFSPAQKRAFAQVLAAELWRSGESSLDWTALHKSVMAGLHDVLPAAPPEAALLEIQGGSFLVRDGQGRFRFAHKSFLEFFMAKGLLHGLERNPEQVLDTAALTPEVAAFVAELLRARGTGVDDPAMQSLRRWLVGGREGRLEGSARSAANALRLLRDVARELDEPAGWVPDRADLRGVVFTGEELEGLRVREARFGRARLVGVEFRGTDLRGSSMQDAELRDARFWQAALDGVDFDRAELSGTEGHACSLAGAKFRRARMQGAVWTGGDWREAEVEGVAVGPTIVEGLDAMGGLRPPIAGARVVFGSGHTGWVRAVAWSPDGRRIASASDDHTVRLWDADDGRLLLTLQGHSNSVWSVAWSPDGRRIASASSDRTVRLWEVEDGRALLTLQGHSHSIWSVAWSPDGCRLASASDDETVRLWDAEEGRALLKLQHRSRVVSVAWSSDGRRLASASDDETVRLWDTDVGRALLTLQGHPSRVRSVAWSPDGRRLASAVDATVRLWDADDGRPLHTLLGHANSVFSVSWSPDGRRLASASHDSSVHVWDADNGRSLLILQHHSKWIWCAAWSPDGRRLASASNDGSVRVWDANDGRPLLALQRHSNSVLSAAWSPDGRRLASASSDGFVRLWGADDGRSLTLQGHSDSVLSVAWSPDGRRLASASVDDTVRLWDAGDGRPLLTLQGHSDSVFSVVWSPDGRRLASASHDYTVRLWDADDGRPLLTLRGHSDSVLSVAWSPDGRRLASASKDKTVRLWDAENGEPLLTLQGHSQQVWSVAWSPDGRRIASASFDDTVTLWDTNDGRPLLTLRHSDSVWSVAWSPDGRRIASASEDQTVRLWDAEDGRPLLTLQGHSHPVVSVAWSPDGRRLVSASHDGTMRLWGTESPTVLRAHEDSATSISFASDGTHFASCSGDRSIRVWGTPSFTQTAASPWQSSKPLAITHSPSGAHIATASEDCRVRIWDANTLTHVRTLAGHTRDATAVAYSPDGKLLASGGADRTLRLWEPATGELLATAHHEHWVNCVVFSPDGTKLASGSSNYDIRVWSVPKLDKLLEIRDAHAHYVNGIAWYPSADRFVSSSWDAKLRIWDANGGRQVGEIVGHTDAIRGLAFAPDGTRFASVSHDRTLRIWDAQTYEQLELFLCEHRLRRVAWSPDGTQIISGTGDGRVYIWRLDPCLAIFQTAGEASLVRTPSGHFCLQPESAEAYLEIPRPDRSAVFYLPLAGIREQQSREAITRALAGAPTRSLAQQLGWSPTPWDGEVRTISRTHPRPALRLISTQSREIIPNPFSPDTALRDSLPGRRVEIDKVVQVLGRRGVAWLRGPRRAGKTSFLNFIAKHTPGYQFFSRSLQAGSVATPDDIARLLDPDLRHSPAPAEEFLAQLRVLSAPVIMLDEIAVLVEAEAVTLRWLRALGQERASLIYSGSHHDWVLVKQRMRQVPGSSFGNDVTFVDFGPIPEPDAHEFLRNTAPEQAPISATLASWVVEKCGTWPYYLQVLGYALVEEQTLHQRSPAAMSRGDFHEFYRRVLLQDKDNYFDLRWQEFTPRARTILLAALEHAREHRTLRSPSELSKVQTRILRDEGAIGRRGWTIDKPFLDWMLENIDMLDAEEIES